MHARARFLIAAFLTICPWPATRVPLAFERAAAQEMCGDVQVNLEVPVAEDFAHPLDDAADLPGLSNLAICDAETASVEEESPTTVTFLPRGGLCDSLLSSIASIPRPNTWATCPSRHAPLRC